MCSLLYRNVFILFIPEGIQLDRYSLPLWEAPRCHSRLLGQCRLHPRGLTALPYQAHGLLQCLKGQLVLQTGSTHTSWQLSGLRCPRQDLHIWGVRSRWVHESTRWNFSHHTWLWDWILSEKHLIMMFLYVFLQAALLWTFSSATIQEPNLGRSNPACWWLAAATAQWRPTGSSMSVEEQWATTCQAEFSTTVKFTTPAHSSESEPCEKTKRNQITAKKAG